MNPKTLQLIQNQIYTYLEIVDRAHLQNIKRVCEERLKEMEVDA